MHRYRNLMVALSRTDQDAALIRYVAAVAQLGTAREVHFVYVMAAGANVPVSSHDQVLSELQAMVRRHSKDMPASVETTYEVLTGPLTDQLLALTAERQTGLLLLGHRIEPPGRKPLARRLAM